MLSVTGKVKETTRVLFSVPKLPPNTINKEVHSLQSDLYWIG